MSEPVATTAMPSNTELGDSTIFHHVAVPGGPMPKPVIRFSELIPQDIAAVLRTCWDARHDERAITFHLLKNVYVVGEGLVFDQDLNLIVDSIAQNDAALIQLGFKQLSEGVREGTVPYQRGTTLLCGKIGMSNYGHWLVEMLPIAMLSLYWIERKLWRVFLPTIYSWMKDVITDSLGLLGIGSDDCILGDGGPRRFEELVFVTNLSFHGHFYAPVGVECLRTIGQSIVSGPACPVWVSRVGERRSLESEAALCEALEEVGWSVMRPGTLTLRQQIAVAKGATHMAGVSGAGLTNAAFMLPGNRVTSFTPAQMPDIFYWHLAVHGGLEFREVRCRTESAPAWHIPWDGALKLSIQEVFAQLNE